MAAASGTAGLVVERGDFQTPAPLAAAVCALIARRGFAPAAILEPTCGRGALLLAALEAFPDARVAVGRDLDPGHLAAARRAIGRRGDRGGPRVELRRGDFYATDWPRLLARLPDPLLVIGNPPWVTSDRLGTLGGGNRPPRSNRGGRRGIDALTGSGNFDISEAMVGAALGWLGGRRGMVAMLVKTAVARRVLETAWRDRLPLGECTIHRFDGRRYFGAAVDACLLVVVSGTGSGNGDGDCRDFADFEDPVPGTVFGLRAGRLLADVAAWKRWHHLEVATPVRRWRSGIKHDCALVLEIVRDGSGYRNRLGEAVSVEPELLYPLLKSADLTGRRRPGPAERYLLVTQNRLGDDTRRLADRAPRAWRYLLAHASWLDRRRSAVYRQRPRFALFGVGEYAFAAHKVATPGLAKTPVFRPVAPVGGKPVVLDDTCYFLACGSAAEAARIARSLDARPARELLAAYTFRDGKRPVTAEILNRLDLEALAREVGA